MVRTNKKFARALGVALLAILFVVSALACRPHGQSLNELTAPQDAAAAYRARGGDTLNVEVWGEQRLSGERMIRDDGMLTMPLINEVPAGGKTLDQISKEVSQKLAAFIPGASVSVSVSH